MYTYLIKNHVLSSLLLALVLLMGFFSYNQMPSQQYPHINFNWINIITPYPGANATDVEAQITNTLEDAVRKISDVKFVESTSRGGVSSILIRFDDITASLFDKRMQDLRREVDLAKDILPPESQNPKIFEITTANQFPTVTVAVTSKLEDSHLQEQAERIKQDIENIKDVGSIITTGLSTPEIHISLLEEKISALGLNGLEIQESIRQYFVDTSAGKVAIGPFDWSVTIQGKNHELDYLRLIPVSSSLQNITLGDVAVLSYSKKPIDEIVTINGEDAILLSISIKAQSNIINLVESIKSYIKNNEAVFKKLGLSVTITDDQTHTTKKAISVMQKNALFGLIFVLLVTWFFLGTQIAVLTSIAIPFSLAGVFWILQTFDYSLSVMVLLGVVISLGMLVDDAVVVVESIYHKLQRGKDTLTASIEGVKDVIAPVTTSVLTTIAAFLPLILLPGILGKFMLIVPLVVTLALIISLAEAFWLLPSHIVAWNVGFKKQSRINKLRMQVQRNIRRHYTSLLCKVLRNPVLSFLVFVSIFFGSFFMMQSGRIAIDFFKDDPLRLIYINVDMPTGTTIKDTHAKTTEIQKIVEQHLREQEARSVVSISGTAFTDTGPVFGSHYGQITVNLLPRKEGMRSVTEVVKAIRPDITKNTNDVKVSILQLDGGPPVGAAIKVKVLGNKHFEIINAANEIRRYLDSKEEFVDVSDDILPGQRTYSLAIDIDKAQRAGVSPTIIRQTLRLAVDGSEIASYWHQGQKVGVRLQIDAPMESIDDLLKRRISTQNGELVPLSELIIVEKLRAPMSINHYNYQRVITLSSDINKDLTDTKKANDKIKGFWNEISTNHPGASLNFSGQLDDIDESLESMAKLFLFGIGLIYLILGTQFRSFFQPLLILLSVPMAVTGVIITFFISGEAITLYALYGVVALSGLSVNASIVLISITNKSRMQGNRLLSSILYAARRRIIPILITSLTTIAGLSSLALGLAGDSVMWGTMASSMVGGLIVSTLLTSIYIPLFYYLSSKLNLMVKVKKIFKKI